MKIEKEDAKVGDRYEYRLRGKSLEATCPTHSVFIFLELFPLLQDVFPGSGGVSIPDWE